MRRRGRRRKQLLDDLKDRRGYSHLKAEALDRTKWRAGFVRDCGPAVRQTKEWMNTPGSSTWSPSLTYHHPNPVCTSPVPHTCHMSSPSNSNWFDHPISIFADDISFSNLGDSAVLILYHNCCLSLPVCVSSPLKRYINRQEVATDIFRIKYRYAPHNDVSVSDGPLIRRWSHKIII